jgi:hypothetical protein
VIDEDQVFSTLSATHVRNAGNLGDRPLIVLTATRQDDIPLEIPPKDAQAEDDLWVHQLQPELARLSTHGKQIVVDSSHESSAAIFIPTPGVFGSHSRKAAIMSSLNPLHARGLCGNGAHSTYGTT